jgi:hypothetical protein
MENGIDFLKSVKQNYVQYDVMWPINLSQRVYNFSENGVPENECMMIYKGWAPTIEISSRAEYERFKEVNGDSDYRVYEDGILFCTSDAQKINGVVRTVLDYYMDKDYEAAIDGLIDTLKPKKELKRKK